MGGTVNTLRELWSDMPKPMLLFLDFITFYTQQSKCKLLHFCDQVHWNADAGVTRLWHAAHFLPGFWWNDDTFGHSWSCWYCWILTPLSQSLTLHCKCGMSRGGVTRTRWLWVTRLLRTFSQEIGWVDWLNLDLLNTDILHTKNRITCCLYIYLGSFHFTFGN